MISIPIFNILPKSLKWKIYSFPFFKRKLRIDFLLTRNKLFAEQPRILVVGANDGISFDDLFDCLNPENVTGAVLEPSPRYFNELKKNLKHFKKLNFLNLAISKGNKPLLLFQLTQNGLNKLPNWGKGLGSFSKQNLLKYEGIGEKDLESIIVDAISFNSLTRNYGLSIIDYLQIDTEGYDAEIIKMIDFTNFFAHLIKYEVCNLKISDQIEVSSILEKRGYSLIKIKGDMIAYSNNINPIFY